MNNEITSEWTAYIGNNGKQLAIFDFAQHKRNRNYKFKYNKQEIMYVYVLTASKSFIQPTVFKLDMTKLIDNEEVLSFGFNEEKDNN